MKLFSTLILVFCFSLTEIVYSQNCGIGYGINSAYNSDCNYTFTPVIPGGAPPIASYDWWVSSSGTYSAQCDMYTNRNTLTYIFCFSGNHDIRMRVNFQGGQVCYVTITVNVTCSTGPTCNPDLSTASFPDPLVEITYIGVDNSCGTKGACCWHDCMWQSAGGSTYNTACGWIWNVRIVPSTSNCEYFTYHMQYISIDPGSTPAGDECSDDSACVYMALTPGTDYCIHAKVNQTIVIWADGNHCCVPVGYQRAYLWTPVPNCSAGTICEPTNIISDDCDDYRCPTTGSCNEAQQAIDDASPPTTHCFKGGKVLEQRNSRKLIGNADIEQNILIYNVQGAVIYNGKWKFGNPENLNLNWPNGIPPGMYFIQFQNAEGHGLTKLFKMN